MDDFTQLVATIFGGIVVVAIAAVIVSRKSQAPQAIQAISSGIGNIVASAVNPVSAAYGYGNGSQTGTSPSGASGIGPISSWGASAFSNLTTIGAN